LSDTKREIPAEYVPTADQRAQVWLLARRGSLEATMSYYLVERIKAQPNIEVLTRSEVTALEGCDGNLENGALAPLRAAESRSVLAGQEALAHQDIGRLLARLFLWYFLALLAGFGKPDGDCLLSALHRFAASAALESTLLAFMHRLLDLFRSTA
jgi:hypothetical protein